MVLACDVVQFLERIVGQLKTSATNIVSRSLPLGSTASLAALPAMSLIPFAPFPYSRRVDAPLAQLRTATLRGLTVYPSASQRDVFYVADAITSLKRSLLV